MYVRTAYGLLGFPRPTDNVILTAMILFNRELA